jgi:hypothetical protein
LLLCQCHPKGHQAYAPTQSFQTCSLHYRALQPGVPSGDRREIPLTASPQAHNLHQDLPHILLRATSMPPQRPRLQILIIPLAQPHFLKQPRHTRSRIQVLFLDGCQLQVVARILEHVARDGCRDGRRERSARDKDVFGFLAGDFPANGNVPTKGGEVCARGGVIRGRINVGRGAEAVGRMNGNDT